MSSSDVPSAPHNVQHLMDALSGIGTIYEAKQVITGASHALRKQICYNATFESRNLESESFQAVDMFAAIFCRPPPQPRRPHLCPPPSAARLACCVLLPAAMRCSTAGTLLRHALDTAVDKCGGGIVNGVREGGGGEGVERQEVWGGVTWLWWRCLSEKEPEWKERSQLERITKKIITRRSQFKKMLISMEG